MEGEKRGRKEADMNIDTISMSLVFCASEIISVALTLDSFTAAMKNAVVLLEERIDS